MLAIIGFGVFMGLAFAVPPGAVAAETLRRGLARGFPEALGVQLGSLVGDATYALLALAGAAALVDNPTARRALLILATILLIYLAISGILSNLTKQVSNEPVGANRHAAFLAGVTLSLTNPWAIGFWLSLAGVLVSFGATASTSSIAIFFLSFFAACLIYAFLAACLSGWAHRTLPARLGRILSLLCSMMLGMLGLGLAAQVIAGFLSS